MSQPQQQTPTFVYEGVEVKKTGRVATKLTPSGKPLSIVEITPVDSMIGSWKRWVPENVLFTIDPIC